jgi:hypothetical protein
MYHYLSTSVVAGIIIISIWWHHFPGHLRVVQALLKKGAILHRDHDGRTPLHLSAKNGHRDTIKLIMNVHSHLLDQTDKDGVSELLIVLCVPRRQIYSLDSIPRILGSYIM